MNKLIKVVCVLFVVFLNLNACTSTVQNEKKLKDFEVKQMYYSTDQYVNRNYTRIHEIARENVNVIVLGDHVKMVLPSDTFFVKNSSSLTSSAYSVLDKIADLIRDQQNFGVRVVGYTDSQGNSLRNLALSRQQAQVVANYLSTKNPDIRALFATGYGASQFIDSNQAKEGRSLNRRVEIDLQLVTNSRQD